MTNAERLIAVQDIDVLGIGYAGWNHVELTNAERLIAVRDIDVLGIGYAGWNHVEMTNVERLITVRDIDALGIGCDGLNWVICGWEKACRTRKKERMNIKDRSMYNWEN